MSHKCPVDGCAKDVSDDMLMCQPDWYKVPAQLRKDVWRAWRNGRGAGSDEHTQAIMAAIEAVNSSD